MNHFLAISDLSPSEVQDILDVALRLKKEYFEKGNQPLFKGKVLGMVFQKPSLRTRVSFDMAMLCISPRTRSDWANASRSRMSPGYYPDTSTL